MAAGNLRRGRGRGYRRRRPLPAIIVLCVLAVTAVIVWFRVLDKGSGDVAVKCDPPRTPPVAISGQPPTSLGQTLAPDALDRTVPAAPALALVHVVNASTQRGQAAEITEALRQLGFSQVSPPANDPLYLAGDLTCRAQIRFGQQGTAAARTLSLVEPCAELVKDNRQDATVDLAIGKRFDNVRPKTEARRLLEQLNKFSLEHPEAQGGLQANPAAQPDLDPSQVAAARNTTCT